MRCVVCLDKFKGTLTAAEACAALADGMRSSSVEWTVLERPIADGGEGTVDALVAAGWDRVSISATGPVGSPVQASFAVRGGTALVEMAQASGIDLLPAGASAPLTASTRGTGELVRAALERGCDEIILAVGGSATTDAGAGMLQALGAKILDPDGNPVGPGGAGLADVARIDLSGLHPRLAAVRVVLASDVDNPLLGPAGAAAVYAPQKGADPQQVVELESALARFAQVVAATTGQDHAGDEGAGAAGGTGFAALAVLAAQRRNGADLLLGEIGISAALDGATLAIVGEGSLDTQSLRGKAPVRVAALARSAGVRVVAVAGQILLDDDQLRAAGIEASYALARMAPSRAAALRNAAALVREAGRRIADEVGATAHTA